MKLSSTATFVLALAGPALLAPTSMRAQSSVAYNYNYSGAPLPIFRDSANIVSVADLFVPKAILISKVTVNVEIDYPIVGDLNLFLYSPSGTRTKLIERNCGGQGTLLNINFDDAAPTLYSNACPLREGGAYRGNDSLGNLNGQLAFGTWQLAIENSASDERVGFVRGFSLSFTGTALLNKPVTAPQAVFNAAGFQTLVVAPGELVNIIGLNMGPASAVTPGTRDLPTSLGGVQVTFDGTPAALSYVSPFVVTAQVPSNVAPDRKTEMRVVYEGASSDPVIIDVKRVVPGVYTKSAIGKGTVDATNADGSFNSQEHPAPKGTFVVVYATGLGTITPELANGVAAPVSPPYATTTSVSASIDGYPANVNFAGAAPGLPGVYQVNVQIPTVVDPGPRPLTIQAGGGQASQGSVVIWVQ